MLQPFAWAGRYVLVSHGLCADADMHDYVHSAVAVNLDDAHLGENPLPADSGATRS